MLVLICLPFKVVDSWFCFAVLDLVVCSLGVCCFICSVLILVWLPSLAL